MATVKAFRLVPFNKTQEEIPLKENRFYVDVETNPDYWKDVVIVSSKNKAELEQLHKDFTSLKTNPLFAGKFLVFNHYVNDDDRIDFFVLQEYEGTVE
jgi:hypothetical protein